MGCNGIKKVYGWLPRGGLEAVSGFPSSGGAPPPALLKLLTMVPLDQAAFMFYSVENMSYTLTAVLNAAVWKFGSDKYGASNFPELKEGGNSPDVASKLTEKLVTLLNEAVAQFQLEYTKQTGSATSWGGVVRACISQRKMGFFSKYADGCRKAWDEIVGTALKEGRDPPEDHVLVQLNHAVMNAEDPVAVPGIFERSGGSSEEEDL